MESEELYVGDKVEIVGSARRAWASNTRKPKSRVKQRLETRSNVKGGKGSLGFRLWGRGAVNWGIEVTRTQELGMYLSLISLSQGNMQREAQAAREAQQQLALMQAEMRRVEGELDTARRERDALQLEMSLVQVSGRNSEAA